MEELEGDPTTAAAEALIRQLEEEEEACLHTLTTCIPD